MKFQPDRRDGVNLVSRFEGGRVRVNGDEHAASVIVPSAAAVQPWPVRDFSALKAEHFDALVAFEPEIVIFGSGDKLRFPAPALLRSLIERGIGVETMDTAAACRTYNVLATEGRSVVAALLIEAPPA